MTKINCPPSIRNHRFKGIDNMEGKALFIHDECVYVFSLFKLHFNSTELFYIFS